MVHTFGDFLGFNPHRHILKDMGDMTESCPPCQPGGACRFFGLSNGYWLRSQASHDTEVAERGLSSLAHR
jgi:hypothetical protein